MYELGVTFREDFRNVSVHEIKYIIIGGLAFWLVLIRKEGLGT